MMQRFWSWLAVELGRRAGLAAVIGLLITLVLGYGVTRLEFATGQDSYLNKSDQIYKDNVKYQNLFGGQAMLGLVTMDEGHTVNELFDAAGIAQWQSLHDDLSAARMTDAADSPPALPRRRHAADRPAVHRHPRPERRSRDRPDAGVRRTAHAPRPRPGGARLGRVQRPPGRLARHPAAGERRPGRAAHVRQPRLDRLPAARQPGRHPRLAAHVLQRQQPRDDHRAPPRQPVDRRRGASRRRRPGADERAPLRQRHGDGDRRADPARRHQPLPARRDADPRRHRRGDHDAHPAPAVQRAMAAAATRRDPRRRGVGVRSRRLHRDPPDGGHHRRAAGDARRRDRLRDPDARARRGGGDPRSLAAPDPGDRPQPRPGPAGGHVRRHLRLCRALLRQGADDPRLRAAPRRRHRRHLPQLDRDAARHARHPRAPLADARPRLPRGRASGGSPSSSARCRSRSPCPWRSPAW